MTDLEMTRLCAEAMGYKIRHDMSKGADFVMVFDKENATTMFWAPLHDDEFGNHHCMALLKRFALAVLWYEDGQARVMCYRPEKQEATGPLNRAIVECVAKMQAAK